MWKIIALLLAAAACSQPAKTDGEDTKVLGDIIKTETQYLKLRDGVCVGYFWARSDGTASYATGGAVVFPVPCDVLVEKVP
jgi:hypothetical protein